MKNLERGKLFLFATVWVGLLILYGAQVLGQACLPPAPDMVSWWPGDGNAEDIISGYDGAFANGAATAAGLVSDAFSFDGVDDQVVVPHNADLSFGPATPITVDAWLYRTGAAPVMHILGKRSGCGAAGINYQLAFDSTRGLHFGGDIPNIAAAGPGSEPALNQWVHVAGTFDGTTFRIYINGALAGTGGGVLGPANIDPFKVGASGACGMTWAGLIDEVQIFDRALTDQEILDIHNADLLGQCKVFVDADLDPTRDPNTINCSQLNKQLDVAILTTPTFDATTVDHTTVFFEGAMEKHTVGSTTELSRHEKDVDHDGDTDLLFHIVLGETTLTCASTEGYLTGWTFDGTSIWGKAEFNVVGGGPIIIVVGSSPGNFGK